MLTVNIQLTAQRCVRAQPENLQGKQKWEKQESSEVLNPVPERLMGVSKLEGGKKLAGAMLSWRARRPRNKQLFSPATIGPTARAELAEL